VIVKIITFKKPTHKTNFPVTLKNSKGEEIVVNYAKDNYAREKYKHNNKYKQALENPDSWEFDDMTQESDI
jgi:hypothetical protein